MTIGKATKSKPRKTPRVRLHLAAFLEINENERLMCLIHDFSSGGFGIRIPDSVKLKSSLGDILHLYWKPVPTMEYSCWPVALRRINKSALGFEIEMKKISKVQKCVLERLVYFHRKS
jgi:hypothetical protein